VEPIRIQQSHGLLMQSQLSPSQHLEKLFERTEAAGQCNNTITKLVHFRLPFMHRIDDDQFRESFVGDLLSLQKIRQHAHYPPTVSKCTVGYGTHESHFGSAIYQSDT